MISDQIEKDLDRLLKWGAVYSLSHFTAFNVSYFINEPSTTLKIALVGALPYISFLIVFAGLYTRSKRELRRFQDLRVVQEVLDD
jgi:hypothetical protein